MKTRHFCALVLGLAGLALGPAGAQGTAGTASQATPVPAWAYPVNPKDFKPHPDDGSVRRVPGSTAGYTLSQTRDRFLAPDWHPADHPLMPAVVAGGRKPDVYACGYCHRADGSGGPENANIAGLPESYIAQQMRDFRSGARRSSVPQRAPVMLKATLAKAITDEEIAIAATYFAAIAPVWNVRVVEAERVPATSVAGWVHADLKNGQTEALGERILEIADDPDSFELRDARARFTAYVPPGSVRRGQALVNGQVSGKTQACAACHGADLRGLGVAPPILGRSPSYMARQLFDFQNGNRTGTHAIQMKPVVDKLTPADITDIVAYLASVKPGSPGAVAVAQ